MARLLLISLIVGSSLLTTCSACQCSEQQVDDVLEYSDFVVTLRIESSPKLMTLSDGGTYNMYIVSIVKTFKATPEATEALRKAEVYFQTGPHSCSIDEFRVGEVQRIYGHVGDGVARVDHFCGAFGLDQDGKDKDVQTQDKPTSKPTEKPTDKPTDTTADNGEDTPEDYRGMNDYVPPDPDYENGYSNVASTSSKRTSGTSSGIRHRQAVYQVLSGLLVFYITDTFAQRL
ncbi:hypothetical protein HDE_01405 [Halotydeus destructor]|nr:hypothetical protein HDE_01405 [Halotydeus destructor]